MSAKIPNVRGYLSYTSLIPLKLTLMGAQPTKAAAGEEVLEVAVEAMEEEAAQLTAEAVAVLEVVAVILVAAAVEREVRLPN